MSEYRLYFALWPKVEVREAMHDAARRMPGGGPRAYAVNPNRYHVTLLYLGEADENEFQAAMRAGAAVRTDGFTLTLDRFGGFPRARVWWLGTEKMPPGVDALGRKLREACAGEGLVFDPKPLRPHISIVREASGLPPKRDVEPIEWHVDEFMLMNSVLTPKTASYEVLGCWPLRNPDA